MTTSRLTRTGSARHGFAHLHTGRRQGLWLFALILGITCTVGGMALPSAKKAIVATEEKLIMAEDRILFVTAHHQQSDIYSIKDDGTGLERLTNTAALEQSPVYSPDGRAIAFGVAHEQGSRRRQDLYLMTADGLHLRKVTGDGSVDHTITPDGKHLLYSRRERIIRVKTDGAGQRTLISQPGSSPVMSPNGKYVAFRTLSGGLAVQKLDGSAPSPLASVGAEPAFSPDSARLAYVVEGQIFLIDLDGRERRQVTDDSITHASPVFSPEGKRLAFSTPDGIYVQNLDTGACKRVVACSAGHLSWAQVRRVSISSWGSSSEKYPGLPRGYFVWKKVTGDFDDDLWREQAYAAMPLEPRERDLRRPLVVWVVDHGKVIWRREVQGEGFTRVEARDITGDGEPELFFGVSTPTTTAGERTIEFYGYRWKDKQFKTIFDTADALLHYLRMFGSNRARPEA